MRLSTLFICFIFFSFVYAQQHAVESPRVSATSENRARPGKCFPKLKVLNWPINYVLLYNYLVIYFGNLATSTLFYGNNFSGALSLLRCHMVR